MFESLFYITGIAFVVSAVFLYLSVKSADEMQCADAKEINDLMAQLRAEKDESARLRQLLYQSHKDFDQYMGVD